jgi:hypothetical protein
MDSLGSGGVVVEDYELERLVPESLANPGQRALGPRRRQSCEQIGFVAALH